MEIRVKGRVMPRGHRARAGAAWGAAALAVGLALAGSGCAYGRARARDLSDVIAPGISAGGGILLRVNPTRLVAVEVGGAQKDERYLGWRGRNPRWHESSFGVPMSFVWMPGLGEEKRPERRWYDFFTTSRRRTHYPNREIIEDRRHTLFIWSGGSGDRFLDILDIEVGVSAIFGGLELAIRPGELFDFLTGWFGLDLGGDDALTSEVITVLPGSQVGGREPASK